MKLVSRAGVEPPTHGFSVNASGQEVYALVAILV